MADEKETESRLKKILKGFKELFTSDDIVDKIVVDEEDEKGSEKNTREYPSFSFQIDEYKYNLTMDEDNRGWEDGYKVSIYRKRGASTKDVENKLFATYFFAKHYYSKMEEKLRRLKKEAE